MTRPCIDANDKRTKLVQIKFSINEMRRIDAEAKRSHDTITHFVRKCVLERLNGTW